MIKRSLVSMMTALWLSYACCQTAWAQQPESCAHELSAVMRDLARYQSLGLNAGARHKIMAMQTTCPEVQRLIDRTAMVERNKQGKEQGSLPGVVSSFLIGSPFECPSVHDFSLPAEPETDGFDTSKPFQKAVYAIPGWERFDSVGEYGEIWPNQKIGHNGYVAIYLATRIVVPGTTPVAASLEIPSSTPVIAWINGSRVVESLDKGPLNVPLFADRHDVMLRPGENILVIKVASLGSRPAFYAFLSEAETGRPLEFSIDNTAPIVSDKLDEKQSLSPHRSIYKMILDDDTLPVVDRALAARMALSREDADRIVNGLLMNDLSRTSSLSVDDLEIALIAIDDAAKGMMLLQKADERYRGDPRFDLLYARQMIRVKDAQGDKGTRFANEWPEIKNRIGDKPPSDEYIVKYQTVQTLAGIHNRQAKTAFYYANLEQCGDCIEQLMGKYTNEMFQRGDMTQYLRAMESRFEREKNVASFLIYILDTKLRRAVSSNDDKELATALANIQIEIESYLKLHPDVESIWNFWLDVVSAYGVDAPGTTPERLELLKEAGFTPDADALYKNYLSMRVNAYDRWIRYAKFCIDRNRMKDAADACETAAKLKPQDDTLAARADMMRFLSEQNDAEGVNDSFEEPYIVRDIPANHSKDASGIVILLDNSVSRILPSGLSSTFSQFAFELLDQSELEKWRKFNIRYSPIDEKVEIVSVTVTKRDGSVNRLYTTSDFAVGDKGGFGDQKAYNDDRVFQIKIPDLAVGDRVEYRYKLSRKIREASNMLHFSKSVAYQREYITQWFKTTVIAPEFLPIHVMQHNPDGSVEYPAVSSAKDGFSITTVEKKDIPRLLDEPRTPGRTSIVPVLLITSFNSWDHFVQWLMDLHRPQLKIDDAIRAKVRELTNGVTDPLLKVKNIYYYVVKNIRYVGLEFGIHGWKPYPMTKVFERRFGDCKDKASLIKVMLDEAGIPTDFVLIRTRGAGDINMPQVPFPYLFPHAIAYVPQFDLYLDGVAEFSGIHELLPMDQGVWNLVVKDDGSYTIRKTPLSKAEDNYIHEKYIIDLTNQTNVSYHLDKEIGGSKASSYRKKYQIGELQKKYLETEMNEQIAGTHIRQFEFSDITDYDAPVRFSAQATTTLADIVKVNRNQWIIYPGIIEYRTASWLAPSAQRKLPLDFWVPFSTHTEVTYKLPQNAKVALPDDVIENTKFGHFEIHAKYEKNELTTDISFALTQPYISPEDYDEYQAFVQKYDRRLNLQYTVELPQ